MMRLRLFSTSTIHGGSYLEYCSEEIQQFFPTDGHVVFVPFARPSGYTHDEYTEIARKKFNALGFELKGIHEEGDPTNVLSNASGIFTGGGNTFVLLTELYRRGLMDPIKEMVHAGIPYMGTSAGSNMAGLSIQTTNDMPIVYPPSFEAFGFINANLNPHYLDPVEGLKHMGETRETRIKEFHVYNDIPVIGLREGSWIHVEGEEKLLKGAHQTRLFRQGKDAEELASNSDLSFLI